MLRHYFDIIEHHHRENKKLIRLVRRMDDGGDFSVRKQIADLLYAEPCRIPPSMHFEIGRWGRADHLSCLREIREAGRADKQ